MKTKIKGFSLKTGRGGSRMMMIRSILPLISRDKG